ncbi:VP3 [Chicken proventriculitis-associated circular virus 29]|nr:VP3 [Chicken proventriculitis-associated circular virus 29]
MNTDMTMCGSHQPMTESGTTDTTVTLWLYLMSVILAILCPSPTSLPLRTAIRSLISRSREASLHSTPTTSTSPPM